MKTTSLGLLLATTLLTACGGGGGGGGSNSGGSTSAGSTTSTVPAAVDPLYERQWHLKNTGQEGATPGVDINVEPVWQSGNEGAGVTVAVVDDGLEIGHEDLAANISTGQSLNMSANNRAANDPSPSNEYDDHGTAVAGLIAAARNTVGGRGVAPQAKLLGVNVLAAPASDSNDATALLHGKAVIAVSNNSWGNSDRDNELGYAGPLFRAALEQGATLERGGKGIVYLFAAGNGYTLQQRNGIEILTEQRSSYDAYNNTPYAINIGAVKADGFPAEYSEPGANVLVSAPSDSLRSTLPWLFTTALTGSYSGFYYQGATWPFINYRPDFGGTSGATPIAAGVVALMLQANPTLSWRDVRWILANTAKRARDPYNADEYTLIGNGRYNARTGFGLIDAQAAVAMAKVHKALPPMKTCIIDMAPTPIKTTVYWIDSVQSANGCDISKLESADLSIQLEQNGSNSGSVSIVLYSPQSITLLADKHQCYQQDANGTYASRACTTKYNDWTFHSVRQMGENPSGNWALSIQGLASSDQLLGSQLVLRGH